MSRETGGNFVVTLEHRRFAEFCDACRQYRYIGLCYGPPGVGKTLSARYYARWDRVETYQPSTTGPPGDLDDLRGCNTILYTPDVLNGPSRVAKDIDRWRRRLHAISWVPLHQEEEERRAESRRRADEYWDEFLGEAAWFSSSSEMTPREPEPTRRQIAKEYASRCDATPDPTSLILVDEADRLKMPSLEQMRAIFDQGGIGLVFLGMPGLEKRLARYPQLYSRVGFVHEFRPLNVGEVRALLERNWKPAEVSRPLNGLAEEPVLAAIVRITGGNFRLLDRLLAQVARVMEINALQTVTREVVEAARENLVIGSV